MNHATGGEEKAPAEQSNLTLTPLWPASQARAMTTHRGVRRARSSLRLPQALGLREGVPGSSYGSLEEAPRRGDRSLGSSPGVASQEAAGKKGSCGRQALSLKGQEERDEEANQAGEAGDGQLLIGQAHHKTQASTRVKRCQKVNRALQRGWQSFLANVHRLMLMRSASLHTRRW